MKAHIVNSVAIIPSARTTQMAGMFDVLPGATSQTEWDVDLPLGERPWNIGLIVGPSGAGKTTVARELFGDLVIGEQEWSPDRSLLDDFPAELSIKDVIAGLTMVGFSSPPSWLRPYWALSTGEQFRVRIARALADTKGMIVVDEFTSVVDRQVAQFASHTIQKALRRADRQLVAVTCHYDVIDWLQPDWIFQPATGQFDWREPQRRPELRLEICETDRSAWRLFRQHHYLSGALAASAKCVVGWLDDNPVAFAAWLHFPHPSPKTRNLRTGHRLVVLPDYQGLGIGGQLDDWLGQRLYDQGLRYHNTVAHPAMVAYYQRSPRWEMLQRPRVRKMPNGGGATVAGGRTMGKSRATISSRQSKPRLMGLWTFGYVPQE